MKTAVSMDTGKAYVQRIFALVLVALVCLILSPATVALTNITLKPESTTAELDGRELVVIANCENDEQAPQFQSTYHDITTQTTYLLSAADLNSLGCNLSDNKPHKLDLFVSCLGVFHHDPEKIKHPTVISEPCGDLMVSQNDTTHWLLSFGEDEDGLHCQLDRQGPHHVSRLFVTRAP